MSAVDMIKRQALSSARERDEHIRHLCEKVADLMEKIHGHKFTVCIDHARVFVFIRAY